MIHSKCKNFNFCKGWKMGRGLRLRVLEVGTLKNGVKKVSIQYTGCKNKVTNIYKVKCLSLLV